eukprot:6211858-Pleurochrysis_carterae.AAC.2
MRARPTVVSAAWLVGALISTSRCPAHSLRAGPSTIGTRPRATWLATSKIDAIEWTLWQCLYCIDKHNLRLVAARAGTDSGHLKIAWGLASVTSYQWHFCASLMKQDGLTRYTKDVSSVAAAQSIKKSLRTFRVVPCWRATSLDSNKHGNSPTDTSWRNVLSVERRWDLRLVPHSISWLLKTKLGAHLIAHIRHLDDDCTLHLRKA